MAGRIVVFGATGFTGELTARALVRAGHAPVLAGRRREPLRVLADELGGLDVALADATRPGSMDGLLEAGDVLVATVGPYLRFGTAALELAVAAGAHYLDCTGEGQFTRRVFERFGPGDARSGLLSAFGFDFVPGTLAGALALREAGPGATAVDVAYFSPGAGTGAWSGGTRASAAAALLEPAFAFRDGRLHEEPVGRHSWTVRVGSRERVALSMSALEHLALPRVHPSLRDVGVFLGGLDRVARAVQVVSVATSVGLAVPGTRRLARGVAGRLVRGSSGGPDAAARARSGSYVVAVARDRAGGEALAEVRLRGVNAYDFTAEILAWGAAHAAAGGLRGTGALGPVDGFGLDVLEAGCAGAGLERTP